MHRSGARWRSVAHWPVGSICRCGWGSAADVFAVWARQHQLKLRERAAVEAAAKRVKSVAVLPFENVGRDEQNAVLAGGVHREVLSNLAKVAELKVISRTSVMRYKPGMD